MTHRRSLLRCLAAAPVLLARSALASASVEVAGVLLPETVRLADGTPLLLNGAGTRTKFWVDVYVAALYLPTRLRTPEAVLATPRANRMYMRFLHDELSAERIREAWREGFEDNNAADVLEPLWPRLTRFMALFPDARRGDEVTLDYLPSQGTAVHLNDRLADVVEGDDFNRVLLSVWLGPRPADRRLQQRMLGA